MSAHGFVILPFMLFGCFGIAMLGMLALWIWALVDCITKEPDKGNDKLIWVLVIVLANWIGALLYLLIRRPQRIREQGR